MKRLIVKLAIFLLLGAIINVAVAWGLVMNDPSQSLPNYWNTVSFKQGEWGDWKWLSFTSQIAAGRARARCGFHGKEARVDGRFSYFVEQSPLEEIVASWSQATLPCAGDNQRSMYVRIVDLSGWPCPALQSKWERQLENVDNGEYWSHRMDWKVTSPFGIELPDRVRAGAFDQASPRILPLRPIFPGFAINTIFYAAIVWALFAVPGYIKRRRRIKRGLCSRCAYPVGTNEKCTECGASVRC